MQTAGHSLSSPGPGQKKPGGQAAKGDPPPPGQMLPARGACTAAAKSVTPLLSSKLACCATCT